jgi:hypothetical protein
VLDRDVGPQRVILNALDLKDSELPSKLLERYQVGWTLLLPGLPAIAPLGQLPGWKRLYSDETVVFTSARRLNAKNSYGDAIGARAVIHIRMAARAGTSTYFYVTTAKSTDAPNSYPRRGEIITDIDRRHCLDDEYPDQQVNHIEGVGDIPEKRRGLVFHRPDIWARQNERGKG